MLKSEMKTVIDIIRNATASKWNFSHNMKVEKLTALYFLRKKSNKTEDQALSLCLPMRIVYMWT